MSFLVVQICLLFGMSLVAAQPFAEGECQEIARTAVSERKSNCYLRVLAVLDSPQSHDIYMQMQC